MSQQIINVGAEAGDGGGDSLRDGGIKINENFTELYAVSTPLDSLGDVLANSTQDGNNLILNMGAYVLKSVNLGSANLIVGGGTAIIGYTSELSNITTNSPNPTVTFADGGFNASGMTGTAGIRVDNTGGGAAVRVQDAGTIAFLTNLFSGVSGSALEINNASGVGVTNFTALNCVNGMVMTGAANAGPIINNFNPVGATGKGVDIQGDITSGAFRLNGSIISSNGVGVDIQGDIQGFEFSGDSVSQTANGMRITGSIAGGALIEKTNILSYGSDGVDISGSSISNLICNSAGMTSLSGAAGLRGDADSANIIDTAIISISNIRSIGGSPLSGITKKDIKYHFSQAGPQITDSVDIGCFTLDVESETTIDIQGEDGAVTAYADAGGSETTVTSASHGLSNGDPVSIQGTVEYNGLYSITGVTTDTYNIARAFVTNEAIGNWESGWVKLAGATTPCSTIERFDMPSNNELRSLDRKTIPATYNATISGYKSGAPAVAYQFAVFMDDTNGYSKVNGSVAADFTNRGASLSLRIPLEVSENYSLSTYVRNIEGTNNINLTALTVDVS